MIPILVAMLKETLNFRAMNPVVQLYISFVRPSKKRAEIVKRHND